MGHSPTRLVVIKLFVTLALIWVLGLASAQANEKLFSSQWPNTDFSLASVPLDEIISGGVPKDGIPAVHNPTFLTLDDNIDLLPREGVMTIELKGHLPRAYPIRYLLWHEIVNDQIGEQKIAVTYCPLCNSGVFFSRELNGQTLTFGVSGLLRNSDMVMYDLETESWWQQALGTGIVGSHTGNSLVQLPGWTESWHDFLTRNKDKGGLVMAQPEFRRPYGQNPYKGYELSVSPFLYTKEFKQEGIGPLARVVKVGQRAWPLERLILEGRIEEHGIVLTWTGGQASPLDTASVGQGINVGTVRVRDLETGEDLAHDLLFAFAFEAFFPDGEWEMGNLLSNN